MPISLNVRSLRMACRKIETSAVRWLVSASGARSEEAYREAYAIRRQVVLSFGVHLHLCTHPGTAGE